MRSGFIGPIKEHGPHSKSSRKPLNSSYFVRENCKQNNWRQEGHFHNPGKSQEQGKRRAVVGYIPEMLRRLSTRLGNCLAIGGEGKGES